MNVSRLFLGNIILACSLQPASRIPEASHRSLLHMVHKLASCFSDGRLVVLIPHGLSGQTSSASGWGSFSGTHRKFNRQDQWSNQRGWSIVFNQPENLRVCLSLVLVLHPLKDQCPFSGTVLLNQLENVRGCLIVRSISGRA
jgi:hypothetical protein